MVERPRTRATSDAEMVDDEEWKRGQRLLTPATISASEKVKVAARQGHRRRRTSVHWQPEELGQRWGSAGEGRGMGDKGWVGSKGGVRIAWVRMTEKHKKEEKNSNARGKTLELKMSCYCSCYCILFYSSCYCSFNFIFCCSCS